MGPTFCCRPMASGVGVSLPYAQFVRYYLNISNGTLSKVHVRFRPLGSGYTMIWWRQVNPLWERYSYSVESPGSDIVVFPDFPMPLHDVFSDIPDFGDVRSADVPALLLNRLAKFRRQATPTSRRWVALGWPALA